MGECLSLALAFSAFDAFVEDRGLDNALASMKKVFSMPNNDVRALFEPRPAELLAEAGTDWGRLTAAAAAARERARDRHAATLARRPRLEAVVDWRSEAGQGITIETKLFGAPRYAAYYRSLSPWTTDAGEMPRLDVRGSTAVLPLSPSRRERVLTVIEVDDEVLDCPVRVLAERLQFR